jgi:hypothetical protein
MTITESDKELYEEAITLWGEDDQLDMAIEEMAELIEAICHYRRNRKEPEDVANEIADVEIMMEQMRILIDSDALVNEIKQKKLIRLRERVENYKEKQKRLRDAGVT